MPKKRSALSSIVACVLAIGAAQVQAAGIGDGGSGAVLGQPLDFVVQLRVEPQEVLSADCVAAEVTAGDRRLPAALVRTLVERTGAETARVRVQTTQGLEEPIIGILLQVGCTTRMSRRFVVLADPPGMAPQVAPPAMAAVPLVPAAQPLAQAAERSPATNAAQQTAGAAPARVAAARPPRPAAPAQPTQPAADPRTPDRKAAAPAQAAAAAKVAAPPQRVARADPAPRLKLDVAEALPGSNQVIEQALDAVAQAASATRAANAAASAAEQRIATLERTMDLLRSEARQHRAEAAEMRERLQRGEATSPWLWPLLLGLLLLGGMTLWLARELAAVRRAQQRTWQQGLKGMPSTEQAQARAAEAEHASTTKIPTSPIPFVTSEIAQPPGLPLRSAVPPGRAWPPPAPADNFASDTLPPEAGSVQALSAEERAAHRTMPLPQVGFGPDAGSPRDVSIEELIDLEQQAEFFVVLGQDEAAVDLLVEHLRSTGGGSPLPYLKLLEIHHRRGDHGAYDRTRSRFNQRFNAYAPDWDAGLQHGRSLEDYAGVLPRLQQVWPRPLDAMAELEALLFRKSRGDLFDLPAYRDVLFLYSLARDLLDREAASTGDVDLLLPLADGGEFGSTTPHPYFGLEHDSVFDGVDADDRPTSPVDLDLSTGEHPSQRIFDPLTASRSRS
jgi:hypothetical protein